MRIEIKARLLAN